jgi:hypothetical protein
MDREGIGAREWSDAVISAIDAGVAPGSEAPVLVGHSISGLCIPLVASRRAIERMIFLGALLPVPGMSFVEHLQAHPTAITFPPFDAGGTGPFGLTWESVREGFYHDCPPDLARQAFHDMRSQSFTAFTETCPLTAWPEVSSTYIVMADDRAVDGDWARRNAIRVGADLLALEGGHSPFFSRPAELAHMLLSCV